MEEATPFSDLPGKVFQVSVSEVVKEEHKLDWSVNPDRYETAYHGTSITNIISILSDGFKFGPSTNLKNRNRAIYMENYDRLCNLISTHIPYIPMIDEDDPKPANQVWGCICEVAVDTHFKKNSKDQWCTVNRNSVQLQTLYRHAISVFSIFDDGLSGCIKIHRGYLYQLRTQGKDAFTSRELAAVTDPEKQRLTYGKTLLAATRTSSTKFGEEPIVALDHKEILIASESEDKTIEEEPT